MNAIKRIDGARPRGKHHHRRLAGDTRVTFGRHCTGLLVVHEGATQPFMPSQGLIEEHSATTGHGKDLLDALLHQPLRDSLGDTHVQIPRFRMRFLSVGVSL
ncbi:hypothetical protein D3C72_1568260 [compost metagenome]